ncbi:hypothetical protein [Castellaniella sp.]|uniref:hypothetical protein n=1 Tax=Castellaniella sp. TaxID=1955812 RepID=UPI002AFFEF08|nr:hypothetical protein [Castellaniella sp.]
MPYATAGGVSRADMSDDPAWIEIDESQYAAALAGMQSGKIVSIDGGFDLVDPPKPEEPPAPDPEPDGPPTVVTRAQGKAALIGASLWAQVQAYVDAIEDPTQQALARVALDDTTEWRRDSPFLATAAAALGLTDKQLDDLFVAAVSIVL